MQNPTSTSLTLPKLTAEHVWEKIGPKVRIQLAMAAALDGLTPSARELVFLKSPEAARVLGEDEKELQKARKRRRDIESAREDARAAGKPLPDFDPLDLESLPPHELVPRLRARRRPYRHGMQALRREARRARSKRPLVDRGRRGHDRRARRGAISPSRVENSASGGTSPGWKDQWMRAIGPAPSLPASRRFATPACERSATVNPDRPSFGWHLRSGSPLGSATSDPGLRELDRPRQAERATRAARADRSPKELRAWLGDPRVPGRQRSTGD